MPNEYNNRSCVHFPHSKRYFALFYSQENAKYLPQAFVQYETRADSKGTLNEHEFKEWQ